jgi:hypothetical protein
MVGIEADNHLHSILFLLIKMKVVYRLCNAFREPARDSIIDGRNGDQTKA